MSSSPALGVELTLKKKKKKEGTWVAQSDEHLTSGHDLTVREFEPSIELTSVSTQPDWTLLSPSLSAPPPLHSVSHSKINKSWGAWVAQSVKCLTLAQVTISQSVSSSPASGSGLTAQSLEPASDSVSPSLSVPPLLSLSLSLSQHTSKFFFFK